MSNPYFCFTTAGACDMQSPAFTIIVNVHWGTSYGENGRQEHWHASYETNLTLQECIENENALMKVLTKRVKFSDWKYLDCTILNKDNNVERDWLGNFDANQEQAIFTQTLNSKLLDKLSSVDICKQTLLCIVHCSDTK